MHTLVNTVNTRNTCPHWWSLDDVLTDVLECAQIGSHVNDLTLADPELFPVFKTAAEIGAAVFIHPWDMPATKLMSKYWMPWYACARCCAASVVMICYSWLLMLLLLTSRCTIFAIRFLAVHNMRAPTFFL